LRLGERLGLDAEERGVVYYVALLVGVGCHTDAHEQAKWFGDDIALKSATYEHELRLQPSHARLDPRRRVLDYEASARHRREGAAVRASAGRRRRRSLMQPWAPSSLPARRA